MLFVKGSILGIDIKGKDGFLFKIWFNGDECVMLDMWFISEVLWMVFFLMVLVVFLILIWIFLFGFLEFF